MTDLIRFGVSIDKSLAAKFDALANERGYTNRSEALRDLIREALVEDEWQRAVGEAVGVITVVYNHEQRELSRKLTHLQHRFSQKIVSTLHVHLDEHNCLEAIVVKGAVDKIKQMADSLISMKGVKHGKLVATTTGKELS